MRVIDLIAVFACFGLIGAAAAEDKKEAKSRADRAQIIGTWLLVKGGGIPAGTPFEFTKTGKLIIKVDANKKTITLEGNYRVTDESNLVITMKTPCGEDKKEIDTVKELSADKLVFVDAAGKEVEFKRAPETKPATK